MLVSINHGSYGSQEMNMPIANPDGSGGFATKYVEMIFIEIGAELYLMNMIFAADGNNLAGHGRKAMVVRINLGLRYFDAAQHLMHMCQ